MKKLMTMVGLLTLSVPLYANCGNGNGRGNGCGGNPPGQTGNPGQPGQPGQNGINGTNGTNGTNGADGSAGVSGAVGPAGAQKPPLLTDFELRLFDTRYFSMSAFDAYQLDPAQDHDLLKTAKNNSYGAKFVFKLGPDYTETKIDALNRKIERLERLLQAEAQAE